MGARNGTHCATGVLCGGDAQPQNDQMSDPLAGAGGLRLVPLENVPTQAIDVWWEDPETQRSWGTGGYGALQTLRLSLDSADGDSTSARKALIALEGGEPVTLIELSPNEDGTADVAILVAPEKRSRGVGRRALEMLVRSQYAEGVREFSAIVAPENVASIKCFEAAGFRGLPAVQADGFPIQLRLDVSKF